MYEEAYLATRIVTAVVLVGIGAWVVIIVILMMCKPATCEKGVDDCKLWLYKFQNDVALCIGVCSIAVGIAGGILDFPKGHLAGLSAGFIFVIILFSFFQIKHDENFYFSHWDETCKNLTDTDRNKRNCIRFRESYVLIMLDILPLLANIANAAIFEDYNF